MPTTPVTPIHLGSQTLVCTDETWVIEHRDHNGDLDQIETIGNDLALNFRLLGVPSPVLNGDRSNVT